MYRWVIFIHILSTLAFFMAHGASAVMAFRLRRERQLERIRAILDLSNAAVPVTYVSVIVLLLSGIAAGIMRSLFSTGWIWASLILMGMLFGLMYYYVFKHYAPIRKAVGLPYRDRSGDQPAREPASEAEIAAVVQASNPVLLSVVSFGLVAVILWLMMFRPF
jgi:predicted integral membrane protein DUF2269